MLIIALFKHILYHCEISVSIVLPPPHSGSKDLNSLEVEAVLFGKEMKSLQDKYPNNILHILTCM